MELYFDSVIIYYTKKLRKTKSFFIRSFMLILQLILVFCIMNKNQTKDLLIPPEILKYDVLIKYLSNGILFRPLL